MELSERPGAESERQKWTQYYLSLNDQEPQESVQFGEEFRACLEQLLPQGGRVLEAGCGAGWQSLALARSGRFQVHLMDFSELALDAAKRAFASAGMQGEFSLGDAFQSGEPEFDVVFNAGVIEHYSLEQQAQLLRGMASRSRKYVVCLAPNRGCYWYWVSRVQNAATANWPFGKESPVIDFRDAFEAAGLTLIRQSYMGRGWTEALLRNLAGISAEIRSVLLESHRSPMISAAQACYLVAGIGQVTEARPSRGQFQKDVMDARHLAGELASTRVELERLRSERSFATERVVELEEAIARFSEVFDAALEGFRSQRAWRAMLAIRRAYTMVLREGWGGRFRLLFGPRRPLDESELLFPLLRKYVRPASPSSAPLRAPPRKYDVIILSIIDFDFRFQRPQQIAARFAHQGHRVFWVSPTRTLPPDSPAAYHLAMLRENIWEVQVRAPGFDLYQHIPSDRMVIEFCQNLRSMYRDWAVAETAIIAQLPFWRRFAADLHQEPASSVIYDCMDHWDTFENVGEFNRTEEKLLAEECDLLVVSAERLTHKFAARDIQSVLVRNGSDFEFFQNAEPLAELAGLARPVIGYYGAIADWIDLDLVYKVARSRPAYSFVLAGQVFGRNTASLESLPNVRLLGPRPYEQMPPLLAAFDVCIIPFLLNQVTDATDPVKLYEYLSQGKPVVATEMNELRQCADLIYLARGAKQFGEQLDAAVAESAPELPARRREFARANSWTSRVQKLDQAIRETFPKVSVLVVTYNSAEFIDPCLQSLLRNTSYPNLEIIVVDNHSTDQSASLAESMAITDRRIQVVRLPENRGFAGGNNAAADLATGLYLVFLNADTIVTPGWIAPLLRHVIIDPSIGLICPLTNFVGNEAKTNVDYLDVRGMEEFAVSLAREKRASSFDLAVAPLFCALMRRELFDQVGGLDQGYEIGMFEDDDLSAAVHACGLRVCVAEDCFVHHFGQGSFSQLPSEQYDRLFNRNRKRFEDKWQRQWTPHTTRPSVRPVSEERRFTPAEFCK